MRAVIFFVLLPFMIIFGISTVGIYLFWFCMIIGLVLCIPAMIAKAFSGNGEG